VPEVAGVLVADSGATKLFAWRIQFGSWRDGIVGIRAFVTKLAVRVLVVVYAVFSPGDYYLRLLLL
jgi:hypothetical protein